MNDTKYSLSELNEFLLEPSFYGIDDEEEVNSIMDTLREAIDHHNELEKFENRRGI